MTHYLLASEKGATNGHDLQTPRLHLQGSRSRGLLSALDVSSSLHSAAFQPLAQLNFKITAVTFQLSPGGLGINRVLLQGT